MVDGPAGRWKMVFAMLVVRMIYSVHRTYEATKILVLPGSCHFPTGRREHLSLWCYLIRASSTISVHCGW